MRILRRYYLVLILVLLPIMLFATGGKEEKVSPPSNQKWATVGENWAFAFEFKENEIEFTVAAPTTGWVGIGFNPSNMMKDADYVLGYVKDGKLAVQDNFGIGNTSHTSDVSLGGEENARAISGTEKNGLTTIVFALPLNSKDIYDKKFVRGNTYTVLLAYGKDGADDFTSMHAKRLAVNVVLE